MERLRQEAATMAVEKPLSGTGRSFAKGVASSLVQELLSIHVESVPGQTMQIPGEYVEPVQLQVVCQSLWESLPADVTVINAQHLQTFGDVEEALKGFYERALEAAQSETDAGEGDLREWFDKELMTTAGTRGTVFRGEEHTGKIPNSAVDVLEDQHIIRAEMRAGGRWYELTHDRLIEPIRKSNEVWFQRQRAVEQQQELEAERKRAEEQQRRAEEQARIASRLRRLTAALIIISLVAIGAAVAAFVQTRMARSQRQLAQEQAGIAEERRIEAEQANAAEAEQRKKAEAAATEAEQRREEADQAKEAEEAQRKVAEEQRQIVLARNLATQADLARNLPADLRVLLAVESVKMLPSSFENVQFLRERSAESADATAARMEHDGYVYSAVFSLDDGRYLATVGNDRFAGIWEVPGGQRVRDIDHESRVNGVSFSPDGKYLATADDNGTAHIWEVSTGKEVLYLVHGDVVYSVAFSPDSGYLATASRDKTARVWEITSGQEVARMDHQDEVYSVCFSLDGSYLATASRDRYARIWLLLPEDLIARARSYVNRNFTQEEWLKYLGDENYRETWSDLPVLGE